MKMTSNVTGSSHNVNQLFSSILRMTGHKVNHIVAIDIIKLSKKVGKIIIKATILTVRINVLTKKSDVLISFRYKTTNLFYNVLLATTSLSTPHIRHNTV